MRLLGDEQKSVPVARLPHVIKWVLVAEDIIVKRLNPEFDEVATLAHDCQVCGIHSINLIGLVGAVFHKQSDKCNNLSKLYQYIRHHFLCTDCCAAKRRHWCFCHDIIIANIGC